MSEPADLAPDPGYVRWAQEARRRGRSVARVMPFTAPHVVTADELFGRDPDELPTGAPELAAGEE